MGCVGQRRTLSFLYSLRNKLKQAVEKTPRKAPGLEIAPRFPLYTLPLRRQLIIFLFSPRSAWDNTRMAEQSNGLPEACGTKRLLKTEMFMRTGMRATHHGSEPSSIQKPHTFAQTISHRSRTLPLQSRGGPYICTGWIVSVAQL
jgi:hypothetical protein